VDHAKGFWLLLDVMFATFSIFIRMHKDYRINVALNPPLTCGDFDTKLEILYSKMVLEVINVLGLFWLCYNL
jgi:hypothetical protein